MSLYQKASLICSAIAILLSILIPLAQYLFKLAKRRKLSIIPFSSDSLTLLFNESGSYFKLSFCIECQNKNSTISSICAKIIRKSDKLEKTYTWSCFESVYINWFGQNSDNRINSVSYARPCKLSADTLEPFIVEFSNSDTKELRELCSTRDKNLLRYVQFGDKTFTSLDDFHKFYITRDEYHELCGSYKNYLYWFPGEYELIIELHHDVRKKKSFSFNFSVTENEYKSFCKNTDSIIFGQLYKNSNQPMIHFYSVTKSL